MEAGVFSIGRPSSFTIEDVKSSRHHPSVYTQIAVEALEVQPPAGQYRFIGGWRPYNN